MALDPRKYFKVIGEVNSLVDAASSTEDVLRKILRLLAEAINVKYATMWFRDENEILHPYYSICPMDISDKTRRPEEGVVGKVYKSGKNTVINDFENQPIGEIADLYKGLPIKSYICTPIENRSGIIGAIEVMSDENPFNEEEENIIQMVTTIAMIKIDDSDRYSQSYEAREKLLSIKDVTRSFVNGDTVAKVLKGINLDVYKGEFVVLLGESGCGKSTLLNIVGGLDKPDGGSVVFDGREMSRCTEKESTEFRRNNLGYIFQSYNLMPNLTVKENLDLIGELVKDPRDSMELLELVGLSQKANNYSSELSGGQQQRVSIARALVKRPSLILADEPTAALDYETSIEVLTVLEQTYKTGATLFMVTHNEEIAKMADRVVKLRGGKVHEIRVNRYPAKPEELVW